MANDSFKQVSFDLLEECLEKHSDASTWGKGAPGFRENALFQDYHGLLTFRKVHTEFFQVLGTAKSEVR